MIIQCENHYMKEKAKKRNSLKSQNLSPQEEKWKITAFWFCGGFLTLFIAELVIYLIIWNINDWTCVLLLQIILIMPAYLSNAGMLIFGKGGKPLDKGKICKDGNRLFGPGKTLKGLIFGPLFGIAISLIIHAILIGTWSGIENIILSFWGGEREYILFNSTPDVAVNLFKVYMTGARSNEKLWIGILKLTLRVALVSFAAAGGDLLGSWLKRRVNKKRGEPFWGVDQLDFVIPVLLIAIPFIPLDKSIFAVYIFILIFTPFMALISNAISFFAGLKNVPY